MVSLCPVLLWFLSLLIESSGMLLWTADHTFGPRLCSIKDAFILGPPSWTLITKPHLFIHYYELPWQCLSVLGLLNVIGLSPRHNIYIDTYYWAYHSYNNNNNKHIYYTEFNTYWFKDTKKLILLFLYL